MRETRSLQKNIGYKYYESGHMVYLNDNVARQFKADIAQFVRETESGK
jgi:carboxypeptidase C (cathepsin A)